MGNELFLGYQQTKGRDKRDPTFRVSTESTINEKIDAAVELGVTRMKEFGLQILNEEGTKSALQAAFLEVSGKFPGIDGRFFLKLDVPHMALRHAVSKVWAGQRGEKGAVFVWDPFWMPGTEENSATEEEMDGDMKVEACFAPFNAEETKCDPILFATGLPFDRYANKQYHKGGYQDTQLAFVERALAEYAESELGTGDQNDFLWMWLDECSKEVNPDSADFLLNRGYACIPRIGRKNVAGGSYIGGVGSRQGRPCFGKTAGDAGDYGDYGVFFRAGVELKSET